MIKNREMSKDELALVEIIGTCHQNLEDGMVAKLKELRTCLERATNTFSFHSIMVP